MRKIEQELASYAKTCKDAFIDKACDAYCRLCDTKECGDTGECDWVEKFRKRLKPKSLEKQGEQKPKWSDEDEESMQHCCGAIASADYYTMEDKEEMANWLVSLKQRMEEQQ